MRVRQPVMFDPGPLWWQVVQVVTALVILAAGGLAGLVLLARRRRAPSARVTVTPATVDTDPCPTQYRPHPAGIDGVMRSLDAAGAYGGQVTQTPPGDGEPEVLDIGFARLDVDRAARTGDPEVVLALGKSDDQVLMALRALHGAHPDRAVLATRCRPELLARAREEWAGAGPVEVDERAGTIVLGPLPPPRATAVVVCAGTADLPVALECVNTLAVHGISGDLLTDVGIAGLHRLLAELPRIRRAGCVIAIAGMEGALPSVLAGLVRAPVIAVPTSVGYGANLGGLTAALTMLSSCAAGVCVVNVDNGFGAAVVAARMLRWWADSTSTPP